MKIEGRELDIGKHYLNPVTYLPRHVRENGNAGHPDCEQGVIIKINERHVSVLYCKSRTVQITYPNDLVWG